MISEGLTDAFSTPKAMFFGLKGYAFGPLELSFKLFKA